MNRYRKPVSCKYIELFELYNYVIERFFKSFHAVKLFCENCSSANIFLGIPVKISQSRIEEPQVITTSCEA